MSQALPPSDQDFASTSAGGSKVMAWLKLIRLPNVFTSAADIFAGFLLVWRGLEPRASFLALLAASCALYIAGMVLNDVFDVEQDRRERPDRPIPSGRVSLTAARIVGFGLLLLGLMIGGIVGYLVPGEAAYPWRSGVVAVLLAACVLAYDGGLKRTPLGPVAMGLCRVFNWLLAMSLAPAAFATGPAWLGFFEFDQVIVALGIGVYIAGVTWFARKEAGQSAPWQLACALAVMMGGIVLVTMFPNFGDAVRKIPIGPWQFLLVVFGVTIVYRSILAVVDPTPARVQAAVKNAILALIMLDAAIAMVGAGPHWGLAVVTLMAPTLILGYWLYST